MSTVTTANFSNLEEKEMQATSAERFQGICSPSCLCSINENVTLTALATDEGASNNHMLLKDCSTTYVTADSFNDNQHLKVCDEGEQHTSTPLLDKLQDHHESPDSSPVLKRPRLSSDIFPTGGESMTIALQATQPEEWETSHCNDTNSKLLTLPEEQENLEKEMAELRRLGCYIDALEKEIELMAAVSLPFVKEPLAARKTSDTCTRSEESSINRSNLREIEVQGDLTSEKEIAEITQLKSLVDAQKSALIQKDQELETAKKTIEEKEIGITAANNLFRITFEECVRKGVEAQTAQKEVNTTQLVLSHSQPTSCSVPNVVVGQTLPVRVEASVSAAVQTSSLIAAAVPRASTTKNEFTKDEYSRLNRRSVRGVYEGAFPLDPELMYHFANGNVARDFVKVVLEHCFTDDYLATTTLTQMDERHVEEITNTTLTYFIEYRTRKDTIAQTLNKPTVRSFITAILASRKAAAKRRSLK